MLSAVFGSRPSVPGAPAFFAGADSVFQPHVLWVRNVMKALLALVTRAVGPRSTAQVLFSRHRLQVRGVDAGADPAQVVQVHVARDDRHEVEVEASVGQLSTPVGTTHLTVPVGVERAVPDPAVTLNVVPGPVVDPRVGRRPRRSHATIMFLTHATLQATWHTLDIVYRAHHSHVYTLHQDGG